MKIVDEALEKRIVKIMATPARYAYPDPIRGRSEYGYDYHECPKCGHHCLIRGGYAKHYAHAHAPDQKRQIAKRIIKAVRETK